MKLRLKENPTEWLKFTISSAIGLAIMGSLFRWRGWIDANIFTLWLGTAVCLVLLCLLRPEWFRSYYRAGMRVSFRVGQLVSGALLFVFFLLVLTPIGWALRLAGKDLLNLKRPPNAVSYWQPAREAGSLERMF